MMRRVLLSVIALLGCLMWAGPATPAVAAGAGALEVLAGLPVVVDHGGYVRAHYPHWQPSSSHPGCDVRDDVLIAESLTPVRIGAGCRLVGGTWLSAYDGVRTSRPSTFDVDHFVPLAEADRSGGYAWDTTTRTAYANDLGFSGGLIAVSAKSNRAKSDKDPARWLPQGPYRCTYAATWVAVKYRWALGVDVAEKDALHRILTGCGDPKVQLPDRAVVGAGTPGAPSTVSSPQPAAPAPKAPAPGRGGPLDPRFSSCKLALAAGFGHYVRGVDPEYSWYRDGDNDGVACE